VSDADDTALCALCGDDTGVDLAWAAACPGIVCTACEARAVNSEGEPPVHAPTVDTGDNPVFIDEKKCWRRFRAGGYVTMLDRFDSASLESYLAQANPEAEPLDEDEELEDDVAPVGDVASTISELRTSLAEVADERKLLEVLGAGLERLRALYRHDRAAFADGDVAYLKGIARIVEAIVAFTETLDGLPPFSDGAQLAAARVRLRAVEPLLAPFAVGGRVSEELRARSAPSLDSPGAPEPPRPRPVEEPRVEAKICPEGHRMVVRRGLDGRYWECSRHPDCPATADIE
jgi:hypothetical protein